MYLWFKRLFYKTCGHCGLILFYLNWYFFCIISSCSLWNRNPRFSIHLFFFSIAVLQEDSLRLSCISYCQTSESKKPASRLHGWKFGYLHFENRTPTKLPLDPTFFVLIYFSNLLLLLTSELKNWYKFEFTEHCSLLVLVLNAQLFVQIKEKTPILAASVIIEQILYKYKIIGSFHLMKLSTSFEYSPTAFIRYNE